MRYLIRCYCTIILTGLLVASGARADENQLNSFLAQDCYYHGNFEQTRSLDFLPVPLVSSGSFVFSCDHGVVWQTLQPLFETVIYTTDSLHFRMQQHDRIDLLQGILHSNMATMLRAIMGGDTGLIENNFSVSTLDQNNMSLTPRKATVAKYLHQIDLGKEPQGLSISMINSETESTRIVISELEVFTTLSFSQCEALFKATVLACKALFTPREVADAIGSQR